MMGYHVRSGITPPFPPTYKLPKLLHFFDRGFLGRGANPIVKKQNKTKQKISVILKGLCTTAVVYVLPCGFTLWLLQSKVIEDIVSPL